MLRSLRAKMDRKISLVLLLTGEARGKFGSKRGGHHTFNVSVKIGRAVKKGAR